jgi:hypothetical protein
MAHRIRFGRIEPGRKINEPALQWGAPEGHANRYGEPEKAAETLLGARRLGWAYDISLLHPASSLDATQDLDFSAHAPNLHCQETGEENQGLFEP